MKDSKERLSVTGKMTENGADSAGRMLAFGAMIFMVLSGAALILAAL
ncbi:hypothetical protein LJR232_004983 [Aquipseudomonas alcaligenes]